MLPKSNRLNIRQYFSEIRGTGKKLYHPLLSLYFRLDQQNQSPQLNVIISKKVAKAAVDRNRMRRLLHTVLQNNLTNLDPRLQGLFFVHKDFSYFKEDELNQLISHLLTQAGLFKHD